MPEFPQPIEYDALPKAVMDYATLAVIGRVARESLVGARLRRVVGLENGEIIMAFDRFTGEEQKAGFGSWLFCADARLYRVHPWVDPVPDKSISSHLVDVCNHHLSGATVGDVTVTRFERIISFRFTRRDYTGEETGYRFIAELMGKHSNLVLVDSSDIILASHKPVHSYQSRVREVRAGKEYHPPPAQQRIEPREFSPDEWRDFLNAAKPGDLVDEHLRRTFLGMSLGWATAVALSAGVSPDKLVSELAPEEGEKLRSALPATLEKVLAGDPLTSETPVEYVRRVTSDFAERAEDFTIDKARAEITRIIDRRRRKLRSLEEGLRKDLDKAAKADEYKKKADLLVANLHSVATGMSQVEVDDWETDEKVVLTLDPYLSPQLQAERWYERYRKLKRTRRVAQERMLSVDAEEEELKELELKLAAAASFDEIDDVREQCVLHGLIAPEKEARGGRGARRDQPAVDQGVGLGRHAAISAHRYRSNDGFLILAGTGDQANHALRRASNAEDMWLHVRDVPGAHVYIISHGRSIPDTTLKEAAMVAAWHSKAREGSNVPVDYTRAKYVDPIPGDRPGKVRFRRERTLRVTPDEERIEMMRLMAGGED